LTNAVISDPLVHDQQWARRNNMVAFAGYPLVVADRLVGVMAMFARTPLSETTLNAMGAAAQSIAVGIERKRGADELRASEERFRELAGNINEVFFVAGPAGEPVEYVSPAYEQIYGQAPETLYRNAHAWLEMVHPEDRRRLRDNLKSAVFGDQEYRILTPKGENRWLRSRKFPVRDKTGKVVRMVGLAEDITKRKEAETHLAVQYAIARILAECSNLPEAAPRILSVICETVGWLWGALWELDARLEILRCVDCRSQEKLPAVDDFVINTRKATFAAGVGLPGRVWSCGEPVWIPDVNQDDNLPRAPYAMKAGLRSAVAFPVLINGKATGVVEFFSREIRKPDQELLEVFSAVGRQIGQFIQRKQAEEQTQDNLRRIRALHEIDKAIASTYELRPVLELLLEKIETFIPVPAATNIRVYNQATESFANTVSRGVDERAWRAQAHHDERLSRDIMEKRRAVLIDNIQTDERGLAPRFFREQGFVSYLGVPLIAKGHVVGTLSLYTRQFHRFDLKEVDFLRTLAGQAAIAIHNAQLFEHIDLSRKELERTNSRLQKTLKQLSGLYTALTPLTGSDSIHEMMEGIIERLMGATGADAALIRLGNDAKDPPLISHRGFPADYLQAYRIVPPGGAVDWVYKHDEPIIAPDIAREPRLKGKRQLRLGLHACVILPLKVHDAVRGIIHLASRKTGYFDEEQRDQLTTIVRQLGIAIENRELFENLKASKNDLERANKVKDEFLSVVSHELRTPLNIIMGYTGLVKDGMMGQVNQEQQEGLQKVLASAGSLFNMINNIMQATRIEARVVKLDCRPVDLNEFIDRLRSYYASMTEKKGVRLIWQFSESSAPVITDSEKLNQILQNLINNACEFTDDGAVTISVRVLPEAHRDPELGGISERERTAAWLEIKVADTGIGIPKAMQAEIFNKFHQVDNSATRSHEGLGLGLYIVKNFTEWLGGNIELDSEPGRGSTFTVTIPNRG
jgi:PAS domain S-box-containing protein